MIVSKQLQKDVNKVLCGEWSAFDFISKYKKAEEDNVLKRFYYEFNFEYQEAVFNQSVHMVFNPLCFENLEDVNRYYHNLLGKPIESSYFDDAISKFSFDPNNFNEKCFKLFIYLSENYSKRGKIKYINIYYFLRDKVDKNEYCFNFIQSEYTNFLIKINEIELKKYQKATYKYEEEVRTLNSLEQQFRAQNK